MNYTTKEFFNAIKSSPNLETYISIVKALEKRDLAISKSIHILENESMKELDNLLLLSLYDYYNDIPNWSCLLKENKSEFLLSKLSTKDIPQPTIVKKEEFIENLGLFTNGLFDKMDWNNVFLMGGAVNACLLPIPSEYETLNDRRKYYHNIQYIGSDIDLYIYGLNEEEASAKLISLGHYFEDTIPMCEITYLRTCYTVTIVTRFPYRHIQIVSKLYSSIPELLIGVDVDCTSVGFDGNNVYASCRAVLSLMTRCNTFNFIQPSKNYSGRLIKYATRGFQVFVTDVDKTRINPQIFLRGSREIGEIAKLFVADVTGLDDVKERFLEKYNPYIIRQNKRGNRRRKNRQTLGVKASDYAALYLPWGINISVDEIVSTMQRKSDILNTEKDILIRGYHYHPCFNSDTIEDILVDHCPECPIIPDTIKDDDLEYMVRGEFSWIVNKDGEISNSFHPLTVEDIWKSFYTDSEISKTIETIQDIQYDRTITFSPESNQINYVNRNFLFDTILNNDIKGFDLLLNNGYRLDVLNEEKMNLIQFCVIHSNSTFLEHILEINKKRTESVMSQDLIDRPDITKYLHKFLNKPWTFDIPKPDIISINNMSENYGKTAFHYALQTCNSGICDLLIKYGCNFKIGFPWGRQNPYLLCSDLTETGTDDYKKMTRYLYNLKVPLIYYNSTTRPLLFDVNNKYLIYLLDEYPESHEVLNVLFSRNNLLINAIQINDCERIRILSKYDMKLSYSSDDIEAYDKRNRQDKTPFTVHSFYLYSSLETIKTLFENYTLPSPTNDEKSHMNSVLSRFTFSSDMPEGLKNALTTLQFSDDGNEMYLIEKGLFHPTEGKVTTLIGNVYIDFKFHYEVRLYPLFTAIENNDLNFITSITKDISTNSFVFINSSLNSLNPFQYACLLGNFDLILPLLTIAINQYHPSISTDCKPSNIRNTELINYASDCDSDMDNGGIDYETELTEFLILHTSDIHPITLLVGQLSLSYNRDSHKFERTKNPGSVLEILLNNTDFSVIQSIYDKLIETKVMTQEFYGELMKNLSSTRHCQEFINFYPIYCNNCPDDSISQLMQSIDGRFELIEWFYNSENKSADIYLEGQKKKRYVTQKNEKELLTYFKPSYNSLLNSIRALINENFEELKCVVEFYKTKYGIELLEENKKEIFDNVQCVGIDEKFSYFNVSINDIILIVSSKLKRKESDPSFDSITSAFEKRLPEIHPDQLLHLLTFPDAVVNIILPFYPWGTLINYHRTQSTTIYHAFIHNLPRSSTILITILEKFFLLNPNGILEEDYKGYTALDEVINEYIKGKADEMIYLVFTEYRKKMNELKLKRQFIKQEQILRGLLLIAHNKQ